MAKICNEIFTRNGKFKCGGEISSTQIANKNLLIASGKLTQQNLPRLKLQHVY